MAHPRKSNQQLREQAAEFRAFFKGPEPLLITTHVSPDGDAVASLLAGMKIASVLGSSATAAIEGQISARFRFLEGAGDVQDFSDGKAPEFKKILVVDAANLERIGCVRRCFSSTAKVLNIDHHEDNTQFGSFNILNSEAASTTEILFDLVRHAEIAVSPQLATCIYTGLLTDTGGFRYSNTTDRTFEIAAELVRLGAQPNRVSKEIFSSYSQDALQVLGQALSNLELHHGGKVATMKVQKVQSREETEDLAEYALKVRGVMASALFRLDPDLIRVSLRGRDRIDVAHIAREFGGGGHPKAAGFTTEMAFGQIYNLIIKALSEEVASKTARSHS